MKLKVYCNDCKYFTNSFSCDEYYCHIIAEIKDSPAQRMELHYDYQVQNRNNDCESYEPNVAKKIIDFLKNK